MLEYTKNQTESQCGNPFRGDTVEADACVTKRNYKIMSGKGEKCGIFPEEKANVGNRKGILSTKSNRNVIIFKKGVAICKRVCYNTVTYIKNKKE